MYFSDEYFMRIALQQAEIAFDEGEIPVGAIIVCQNQVIAKAYNQTEKLNDVTAHAEMLAITAAAQTLGSKYLKDCTLYVTLEPCVMCGGAIFWSQLSRIVWGASDDKRGFKKIGASIMHPKSTISFGVLQEDSTLLLKRFFSQLRT
ncbi:MULTISPECIES: nucleoside deaminase [unclassified Arcicella]|uniref:nucleoside deaminase n=1 Tax=unclassified Arcicella TaxID=2644986 RepID=UPI0028657B00|nr:MULTISPECIES: nucleoside deaminase [unclassified Arcicella]MDR6561245.1 tRNA(adenine34) deaminase [Arcicella sp. BE51]MDR6811129.1 tRNA(adenine34) deaminase [Arcicella sp. BE140]MDR6822479.1 tRNA(adenine34) deaminase [Arcicella sp. BE139]